MNLIAVTGQRRERGRLQQSRRGRGNTPMREGRFAKRRRPHLRLNRQRRLPAMRAGVRIQCRCSLGLDIRTRRCGSFRHGFKRRWFAVHGANWLVLCFRLLRLRLFLRSGGSLRCLCIGRFGFFLGFSPGGFLVCLLLLLLELRYLGGG